MRADEYFQSESFGNVMLEIVRLLADRYRDMDFTDAVATAFVWFERRGAQEPDFLRSGRFPTIGAFRAYVRQALWNSARAAERTRRARAQIAAPAAENELVSPEVSPLWLAAFHECRDRLPEPLRRVFELMQEEEDPPGGLTRDAWAGRILDMNARQIGQAYEQACTRIRKCMGDERFTR